MSTTAFCPGHITGFFTLPSERSELGEERKIRIPKGSRGAGFSVSLGVTAEAEIGGESWDVTVDGEESSFLVVEKTVRQFAEGGTIYIETELPFSQGFGLSGACALAAGTAVLAELGEDLERALPAAHKSEIFCRTGMGDVLGQYHGGFEIRVKEGLPPDGELKVQKIEKDVVLAVAGSPLSTPDVLRDPMMSSWINAVGGDILEEFLPENGFDRFLELSYKFAEETEFIKDGVRSLLDIGNEAGEGSMAMIGNSAFFFGDAERLRELFEKEVGEENVYSTKIDNEGVRLVE
ncbi:MAG: pantoate kinase [Candidatus Natronoplasma sp.]